VTLCNQFPITKPDAILWNKASINLSPARFEILTSKCIGVTTLTF